MAACGGGGGGSSTPPPPPQPTITISGNKEVYRQDEPVVINFSASNLDQNTVSWAVANYDDESFKLDSVNGVFRNVETDYETPKSWLTLPAGKFSLTVTATDGAGKSASRSFQFIINAIPTGFFIAREPNPQGTATRTIGIDFTRDGVAYVESRAYRGNLTDLQYGGLTSQNLVCFGDSEISGALVEGAINCGGQLPSILNTTGYYWNDDLQYEKEILISTEFNEIANIEFSFSSDEDHDYRGTLRFFDAAGGLVETWSDIFLSNQRNSDGFSSSNERLVGRYVAVAAMAQYNTTVINYPDGRFFRDINWGSLILDVKSDYSFNTPADQACQISGTISPSSINELASANDTLGRYFSNNRTRNLETEYSALGCNDIDFTTSPEFIAASALPEPPIELSQVQGSAMFSVYERYDLGNDGEVIGLAIGGPGADQPFRFDVIKACNSDGSPTSFLQSELSYVCEGSAP